MAYEPDSLFFTSDLHLGHKNITRAGTNFCNRPWADPEDMQEGLIRNWNEVVPPGGTVWVLGDMRGTKSGKIEMVEDFLKRTNGTKHLVMGNHDEGWTVSQLRHAGFASVWTARRIITVKDSDGNYRPNPNLTVQEIVLDHYPMRTWKKKSHGAWHIFGHAHGNLPSQDASFDVGMDCWGQRPVSYSQAREHILNVCLKTGKSMDALSEEANPIE